MSKNKRKAFTLTELLVVVVVIGVLAAVVLPKYNKVIETRKTTEAESLMAAVRTEQERRCMLDKPYVSDMTKLASVLPNAVTKNFSYSPKDTGLGMEAQSLGKYDYKLEMPSYADGRICCSGQDCGKLNKNYPTCQELQNSADYRVSLNCGVTPPPQPLTYDCVVVSGPQPPDEPRVCNTCGTQTRSAHCNESTGQWYWKDDWGTCTISDENECREKCPDTCEEGMVRNPDKTYKDEPGSCCLYDCGSVCGHEWESNVPVGQPGDHSGYTGHGPCTARNDALNAQNNGRKYYWDIADETAETPEGCYTCTTNSVVRPYPYEWKAKADVYKEEDDGTRTSLGKYWDNDTCSRFETCPEGYAWKDTNICKKTHQFTPVAHELTAIYTVTGNNGKPQTAGPLLANGGELEIFNFGEGSGAGGVSRINEYCWVYANPLPGRTGQRYLAAGDAIAKKCSDLSRGIEDLCKGCDKYADKCTSYCLADESTSVLQGYIDGVSSIKTQTTNCTFLSSCIDPGIPLRQIANNSCSGNREKYVVPKKTHEDTKIRVYFCEAQ